MAFPARVFVLACALVTSGSACAETPAETARNWGLLGIWRGDCSAEASTSDPDLIYAVRNGTLYHDRNWGSGRDSNVVVAASVAENGGIDLVVRFETLHQTREWIDVKLPDGHIRAVMNRNVDTNQYRIRDGKFVPENTVPGLQTHCR